MKVLVADDHQLYRSGLIAVLEKFDFISIVTDVSNGREVIQKLKTQDFDIVFMDISMPLLNGADATQIIKKEFPHTKVIILTMYVDQKHVMEMIEAGASGYIVKNTTSEELKNALLKVENDELYFSKQISEDLIKSIFLKSKNLKEHVDNQISKREKEILYLICKEYTSKEIATTLYLSEKTVDWHRLRLLQKTNSKNIAGLVLFALKHGLIEDLLCTA